MAEVKDYLKAAEENMSASILFLDETLAHIRAGKASVRLLDPIRVEYYGSMVPISNVANINTPDAKTIAVQAYEKSMISEIEKAIMNSDLGIMPVNNGEMIRIQIPPMTEDRRRELAKQAKHEGEETKISIRNARRDAIDGLKKEVKNGMPEDVQKDGEASVQKIHDKYIKQVDELVAAKEKEIMTV